MIVAALRVVAALGLLALLGISLVPLVGAWPGDMIAPFRLQLAIAALLGLGVAVALRGRWVIGLASVAMVASVLPMAVRVIDRPVLAETASGRAVSLVFSNVLADNREYGKVTALARSQDGDIFAAAETTLEWVAALDELKDWYPHSFAPTDLGVFGVALYAKRPFVGTIERLGRRGLPLLRADFGDMVVYVAHPMPPASQRLTVDNREYLARLAELVGAETLPVVIAGDLNTTLWSENIEPLLRLGVQWPSGSGLGYSWPVARPWLAVQIDHVLTLGIKAGRYEVLGDVGSDHHPVRADLVMWNGPPVAENAKGPL